MDLSATSAFSPVSEIAAARQMCRLIRKAMMPDALQINHPFRGIARSIAEFE